MLTSHCQPQAAASQSPSCVPASIPVGPQPAVAVPWGHAVLGTGRWQRQGPSQGTCKPRGSAPSVWAWGLQAWEPPCSCLHASHTQVPPAQSWWDPHCCRPALTRRGAPQCHGQDHKTCKRPQQQLCPHCGVQVPCSPDRNAPSLLPAAHCTGSPQGSELVPKL